MITAMIDGASTQPPKHRPLLSVESRAGRCRSMPCGQVFVSVARRSLKSAKGYVKELEIVSGDRSTGRQRLKTVQTAGVDEGDSDESAVSEAGRAAISVGMLKRRNIKEHADREPLLEGLAVKVLTALGERDAMIAATEQRAAAALHAMINDEHLTVAETLR
jgi:hypothetical protein